ncbi:hypothetical protein BHE74_00038555 [Ensete ventricosum]|nr:hypothetical protein BHE74_00038555 [Ensete ventricosum]
MGPYLKPNRRFRSHKTAAFYWALVAITPWATRHVVRRRRPFLMRSLPSPSISARTVAFGHLAVLDSTLPAAG